jgi:hypothetical protein
MEDDLGVAVRAEARPLALQLRPQLAVVVDLAVEGDGQLAQVHRLGAGLAQVDDRQAAVGQPRAPVGRHPGGRAVGAAQGHLVARAVERIGVDPLAATIVENGGDPAHRLAIPFGGSEDPVSDRTDELHGRGASERKESKERDADG